MLSQFQHDNIVRYLGTQKVSWFFSQAFYHVFEVHNIIQKVLLISVRISYLIEATIKKYVSLGKWSCIF